MNTMTIEKFEVMNAQELAAVEGGIVITGTAVALGVGIAAGSFAIGYTIGQSLKR
ncbi:Blp family class II bacteriocin [Streptococcus macacae]|uniref:Class IIb bacteriocin, lactobin A/cerein 7B family n=1 Tax=Streptococcus macacae NCTC 11558 TaxID=764298 RepID=G5JW56_9STRE|nr:Blp family class II bacteriocin [Streptococcus macacae]EHJ52476.1 class IIb bacteriocin, lactobin A/cerein 7B family [Streptococcus macacae NCTC 11558]SUN79397.1 Bacteriocin class II with double-glycine leader peptide [Streptococcus macacae NCTC 11558]